MSLNKKYLLYFIVNIIVSSTMFSQDCCSNIAIQIDNWNKLYPGDNYITVSTNDLDIDTCNIITEGNISLKKECCNHYKISTSVSGSENPEDADSRDCFIIIKTKSGKELYKKKYLIIDFLSPDVNLGGKYFGGNISINDFTRETQLYSAMEHLYSNRCDLCQVLRFDMMKISKKGIVAEIQNKGKSFQKEALVLIQNAENGDKFIFYNIYSKCSGTIQKEKLSESLFFLITE